MSRLKEMYKNEIMDAMTKKFGYKNVMEVPKLDKIVINMGVGEAKENKIGKTDTHVDDYVEYVTKRVEPSEIKRVIIPKIFKDYISVPQNVGITWCELKAECYGNNGLEECSNKILEQFAKTAPLMSSEWFNFFRGTTEKRTMIDLYNIEYIF